MTKEIRLYNPELSVSEIEDGIVRIIDATPSDLIEIGVMDSETVPSEKLTRIITAIFGQLGMTWSGEASYWDPMERSIGGTVFVSNPWMRVE
jgi:hypothetical protein